MKKIKYRFIFHITNLDVSEMRDLKISLVNSNNVLQFDSDSLPRIPSKSEKIKIGGKLFEIENSDSEYISEDDQTLNVYNFYVFDVEKKKEEDSKSQFDKSMKAMQKLKSIEKDEYEKKSKLSPYWDPSHRGSIVPPPYLKDWELYL